MKKDDEKILSRREFFKKTAKGALPFLAFGMFGPSILSACSKDEDEEWINQRTGEREPDDSLGNNNNLSGTWSGSFISFVFNSDGSGTYVNAYSGESGSCTYKFTETNKGVISVTSNDSQSFEFYFIVNGNTMILYSNSDYTGQIEQITKQIDSNGGGGNQTPVCSDCSSGCSNGCSDGCSTACYSGCSVQCVGSCSGSCSGTCLQACGGNCTVTCSYRCRSGSK